MTGSQIKAKRLAAGWTQKTFGAVAGLAHNTISQIETGRSPWRRKSAREALERALVLAECAAFLRMLEERG